MRNLHTLMLLGALVWLAGAVVVVAVRAAGAG